MVLSVAAFLGFGLFLFSMVWLATFGGSGPFGPGPTNIFERLDGKSGHCWYRQIFNLSHFNVNKWVCVRCGSQRCIDTFSYMKYISTVSLDYCEEQGWTHEES